MAIKITIKTTREHSDDITAFFADFDALGMEIDPPEELEDILLASDYVDSSLVVPSGDEVSITGFFDSPSIAQILEGIRDLALYQDGITISFVSEDSDKWLEYYKTIFDVIEFDRIAIVPVWKEYEGSKPKVVLEFASSFGTGKHETTKMCIDLLQSQCVQGKSVLDVGCGSGILGLAALRLGASRASFVDIDSQATDATIQNLALNDLTAKSQVFCGYLGDFDSTLCDIVLANLTADIILCNLADIAKRTACGGRVILSGILDTRKQEIKRAVPANFQLEGELTEGDWCALCYRVDKQ